MNQIQLDDVFNLKGIASGAASVEQQSQWLLKHFRLPYNPFPPSGISSEKPQAPPLKDVDGREIAPIIGRFIVSAYQTQGPRQGLVIIGTYGSGKTHLLRLMQEQINGLLEKAIAIYVQRPRAEVHDLNREVLQSLGEGNIRKMLWYAMRAAIADDIREGSAEIQRLRARLDGPLFASAPPGAETPFAKAFVEDSLDDYRAFFEAYDRQGWPREQLREYFTKVFVQSLGVDLPIEVAEAFVAVLLAPDEESRISWESLLALGKKRKLPLMSAPNFLKGLIQLLRLNGYVYAFLLIDEFEEVPGGYLLTNRQKADYLYTLMEALNTIEEGLGLVLAITPEAWTSLSTLSYPFADRLPISIRLGPLDSESVKRLIVSYLAQAREDAGITVDDSLYPLTDALIEQIANRIPDGTPRNILQFSHQLIAHCVENNLVEIEPETVNTVIKDFTEMKTVEFEKRRLGRR